MFWRRRFYKSPITSVPAGQKKCLIRHKGGINIRQLSMRYNGHDTTGSALCRVNIIIDGEEIVHYTLRELARNFCTFLASAHLTAPFVLRRLDDSAKVYDFLWLDLGTVRENFEFWFENVDTANSADVYTGVIYDVYEEGK